MLPSLRGKGHRKKGMVLEMRLKNYNKIILESQEKTESPSVSELNVTEKTKHAATELLGGHLNQHHLLEMQTLEPALDGLLQNLRNGGLGICVLIHSPRNSSAHSNLRSPGLRYIFSSSLLSV